MSPLAETIPTKHSPLKEAFEPAIIEKLILEARRAEEAGRRKFEVQKRARQETRKAKMKQKEKMEHALSRAFSGRVFSGSRRFHSLKDSQDTTQRSKQCIDAKTMQAIDVAHEDLSLRLSGTVKDTITPPDQAMILGRGIFPTLQAQELTLHSSLGPTEMASIDEVMLSLHKDIEAKEQQIFHQQAEWTETQSALDSAYQAISNSNAFGNLMEGKYRLLDPSFACANTLEKEFKAAEAKASKDLEQVCSRAFRLIVEADEVSATSSDISVLQY